MNYEALAKKARYYKQDGKGAAIMCKIMEDMRNEAAQQASQEKAKEKAKLMFQSGKITLDEMRTYFPELSKEEIKELEVEVMQLA